MFERFNKRLRPIAIARFIDYVCRHDILPVMINKFQSSCAIAFFVLLISGCSKKDQPPTPPAVEEKTFTRFEFHMQDNEPVLQDIESTMIADTIYATTFSGTDVSQLKPSFDFKGKSVAVSGTVQTSEKDAQNFSKPVAYTITGNDGSTKTYYVKLEDTHLPAIYISTGNVPITSKETYITGSMWIAGSIAGDTLYNGTLQIRGRGNSTWEMPKKPYKVKLDKKFGLLGMSSDKDWALIANYGDLSLMRNEIAYELSRRLNEPFTVADKYVDVILNGEYEGNYQLTQTIDVSSSKVDIDKQTNAMTTEPDISGGYLLEVDGYAATEPIHFYTPAGLGITVHYPDDDDINTAQVNYITGYYTNFENALFADNFKDSADGYQKYLDVPTFINTYMVNEIIANSDLFWSTYQYKKRNDPKIYTGPVWDFDLAANDDSRLGNSVNKMMIDAGQQPRKWMNRLMEDPAFRHAMRDHWNAIKGSVGDMDALIDKIAAQLASSQKANFKKWDILNQIIHLNLVAPGSYDVEVANLKTYLTTRIPWLDTQFNSSRFD